MNEKTITESGPDSIAKAKAAIDADLKQRAEAANAEITAILQRYGCELAASPQFTADGRITTIVQIVAR